MKTKHGDHKTTRLKMTEMMLGADIAIYAACPPPQDIEVEKKLHHQVVLPPGIYMNITNSSFS